MFYTWMALCLFFNNATVVLCCHIPAISDSSHYIILRLCATDPQQDMSIPGLKDSSYLDMSILQIAVSDVVQGADETVSGQPVQPSISVTDGETTGICHALVFFYLSF